jgi:hypothetical protein
MSWNVVKLERLTPLSSDNILPTITLHTREQLDVERRSSCGTLHTPRISNDMLEFLAPTQHH